MGLGILLLLAVKQIMQKRQETFETDTGV
jgi:hypothetical protein